MITSRKYLCVLLLLLTIIGNQAKKQKSAAITGIEDIKELKKILRSKTNVLIFFTNQLKESQKISDVFKETASLVKGQATLVIIDCSNSEGKKLCKKLKINSDKPYYLKHYKDGEFHKDYDRSETVNSLVNFLKDPTGDLPWEEDPQATSIVHLQDVQALTKFLKRNSIDHQRSMIMFYAPWCGYCKTMKPDYSAAANDLKGEATLAAIDVSKSGNSKIRQTYNITGFPTLLYFEKGSFKTPYNGENKRQALVDFMKDPVTHMQKKKPEPVDESWSEDSDVVHLTGETFDKVLGKVEHALVVFYAPWCGHCKRIKPELENAAAKLKAEKIGGVLAAVDATKNNELAAKFGVKGYPTIKYFNKGEFMYDAGHARQEQQIIDFIKDPKEPPPPPPAEKPWSEDSGPVRHLDATNFRSALKKARHALVMFYAPWCGHCKTTKPEFTEAAERFADELLVLFGAVDCTAQQDLCAQYNVKGYPTIKYYSHYDKQAEDYSSGRKNADFVKFIHSQMGHHETSQKAAKSPQEAGFGASVELAFDDSFEKVIAAPTPTFVMFHAVWCSHCVEAKPAFSKLATALKSEKSPIKAVAVEAAENPKVADLAGVQTLPTFKLYAGGKLLADYTGDRSLEDMMKFCKSHLKVNDEL